MYKKFIIVLVMTAYTTQVHAIDKVQWASRMQDLNKTLVEILTVTCSRARFHAPENKKLIEQELKKLSGFSHALTGQASHSKATDPTLPILAGQLVERSNEALIAFKGGNIEYSRGVLRSISSSCVACHSRNASGPQFTQPVYEPSVTGLTFIELAQFYAATRQFDRSLDQLQTVLKDTKIAKQQSIDWERAVKMGLSLAIRVKKDPDLALKWVDLVLQEKAAPFYLKEDAKSWKESLQAWKKEKPKKRKGIALYSEGHKLMNLALSQQRFPMDHSADVVYLRASSLLYDFLADSAKSSNRADALMLLGIASEVVNPEENEELHRMYYESCVAAVPQSVLAQNCYRRLEKSMIASFSGSSGVHLPQDARAKLKILFKTAYPESKAKWEPGYLNSTDSDDDSANDSQGDSQGDSPSDSEE